MPAGCWPVCQLPPSPGLLSPGRAGGRRLSPGHDRQQMKVSISVSIDTMFPSLNKDTVVWRNGSGIKNACRGRELDSLYPYGSSQASICNSKPTWCTNTHRQNAHTGKINKNFKKEQNEYFKNHKCLSVPCYSGDCCLSFGKQGAGTGGRHSCLHGPDCKRNSNSGLTAVSEAK